MRKWKTSEMNGDYEIINVCDTINKSDLMEEIKMSIVGFIKCKDGVLTLSDSKSSKNWQAEKGRENINKIFYNQSIVVASYGFNTINDVPLEVLMPFVLDKNIYSALDFRDSMLNYLRKVKGDKCGDFLVYEINTNKLFRIFANNINQTINFDNSFAPDVLTLFGGNEYYINCMMQLADSWLELKDCYDITMEEAEKIIKELLEKVIKTLDTLPFNNPCGLPLKFYKFRF